VLRGVRILPSWELAVVGWPGADNATPRRIYADPPYVPAAKAGGGFTSYAGTFAWDDQVRLATALGRAAQRGSRVVASNHDTPEIRALYGDLGFEIHSLSARRSISRTGDRSPAGEVLCCAGPVAPPAGY
jgi:site-specific DNA-adenine methylase